MPAVTPMRADVWIRQARPDEVSRGGVALPPTAQEPVRKGVVVLCGPEVQEVAALDVVAWSQFVGQHVHWDGQDLLIVSEADILYKMLLDEN